MASPPGGANSRACEASVLPTTASKAPAALFPGQGSHVQGMRERVDAQDPELFELVMREAASTRRRSAPWLWWPVAPRIGGGR